MPRHSLKRRVLKRSGVLLGVLVLTAWGLSLVRQVGIGWADRRVSLDDGQIAFWHLRPKNVKLEDWHLYCEPPWGHLSYGFTWVHRGLVKDGGTTLYLVPLWMPLAALALPTALPIRSERRFPRGLCPACGYDLTGNVTGRCPECDQPRAIDARHGDHSA